MFYQIKTVGAKSLLEVIYSATMCGFNHKQSVLAAKRTIVLCINQ